MSRRKQSNPKPLKAEEDESWNDGSKTEHEKLEKFCDTSILPQIKKEMSPIASNESFSSSQDRITPTTITSEQPVTVKIELNGNDSSNECENNATTVIKKVGNTEQSENLFIAKPDKQTSPCHLYNQAEYLNISQNIPTVPTTTTGRYFQTSGSSSTTTNEARQRISNDILDTRQGFLCTPCGIRFSSLSTLEAHQTYYCSHRPKRQARDGAESEGEDVKSLSSSGYEKLEADGSATEPASKVCRTGKQYQCTHCSYSADKKVSLNRHMRMHSVSPASSTANESDTAVQPIDRYCQECDIRFSNLKTFRAHKLHYCSTRNVIKRLSISNSCSPPSLSMDNSGSPPLLSSPPQPNCNQPFLALATNPIVIIPCSLVQSASMLSAPLLPGPVGQNSAYLLLPDGSLQVIAQGIRPPSTPTPDPTPVQNVKPLSSSETSPSKAAKSNSPRKRSPAECSPRPLDLTVRREPPRCESVPIDLFEDEKENRPASIHMDHEDIVCAPSIPIILSTSPACSSPSPTLHSPVIPSTRSRCRRSTASPRNPSSTRSHRRTTFNGDTIVRTTKPEINNDKPVDMPTAFMNGDHATPFNITDILLAAASHSNLDIARDGFPPELLPHLSAILAHSQIATKGINPLNTIPNLPLLLPSLPPNSRSASELLTNPSILPLLTSEMAMRVAASHTPVTPQLPRQGTWKCEDCNIGFCKYENYVAHKKHYCSSRKLETPIVAEEPIVGPSTSPQSVKVNQSPPHAGSKDSTSVPVPLVSHTSRTSTNHLVCNACGIKFSSPDNLTTHQRIYCTSNGGTQVENCVKSSLKCPKCKLLLPADQLPSHQCLPFSSGWKCPCCATICTTSNSIQKHIESHSSVKAFLCTICNYKGNTVRGMRTHIRVHFDKRSGDIMEENYISCIVEANGSVIKPNDDSSIPDGRLSCSESLSSNEECKEKLKSPEIQSIDEEDEYIDVDALPAVPKPDPEAMDLDEPSESVTSDPPDDLSTSNNNEKRYDPKYCTSCDISFNYLSTFIAHKKYYCPNLQTATSTNASENGSVILPTGIATPPI